MTVVRTAVVILSLLLAVTGTMQAEPSREDAASSPTALPSPAPEATPSPTAPLAQGNQSPTDRLRRAIEQAAGFLETRNLGADHLWIVTQGALLLGPKFKAWARTLKFDPALVAAAKQPPLKANGQLGPALGRLWSLRALPQRKIAALPKPEVTPVAGVESRRFNDETTGDVILVWVLSVACRDQPPDLRAKWLKLLSPDKHNYLPTAQLFGVMLAYNQGCLTPGVANPVRRELATQTFRELNEDVPTMDNLAIMRIAALCYAEVCEWIDPELINRLVSSQQSSGSWGKSNPNLPGLALATEDGTAAFAFYALAHTWSVREASRHTPGPLPPHNK